MDRMDGVTMDELGKECLAEWLQELQGFRAIGLTPAQLLEVDKMYTELAAEYGRVKKELEEYKRLEQQNSGWIPVSERLPESDGMYIVTFDDGYVTSAPFENGDWELWCDSGEPIAWMPLPERYREKEGCD